MTTEFAMKAALGLIPGIATVNKYGIAPDGIQTSLTDVWSRADSTPTQQIWLAPTAARIHQLVSTSANDTLLGSGARQVRVYGLQTWDTPESYEDVDMNGTTPVSTVNSYVIIHRMKVLPSDSTIINDGTITATANTDSTVTAVIIAGEGQTEMAIYGVPSVKDFLLTKIGAGVDRAGGAVRTVDFQLRVNESPNLNTTKFIRKHDVSVQSTGTSTAPLSFEDAPIRYSGPCIIKIQGIASNDDVDAHAFFNGYLVDKGWGT